MIQIFDVFTGVTTLYDMASNGVPQHIVQFYKDTIQLVFMQNNTPGLPSSDRRCLYLASTNTGQNWSDLGNITGNVTSGFPVISQFSDGRAVIGLHAALGSLGAHTIIAHDLAPLVGVFITCDPGLLPGSNLGVWSRLVTTPNNKVIFMASINSATANPAVYINTLTNPNNCIFSGWMPYPDIDNAEQYALARASNGTIGLAYITRNDIVPSNGGDVKFMESTNDGLTWSSPLTIWNAQPDPIEFLGALRGIDLVYSGNTPKLVFDLIWQTDAGSYYPWFNGRIMFWSPNINGGVPIVLADSTKVPDRPILSSGAINDVYVNISRASIGKSADDQQLFCAFSVAKSEVSPYPDSTPFFDVYLAWSGNQGAVWYGFDSVTNLSGPVRDCRYPNLAPVNDYDLNYYYANIEYLNDAVPGSAVNGAAESPAQQHFLRASILFVGINNNGTGLPENYELQQNYPNPFNPSTKIKIAVSEYAEITLTVYSVTGKEISKLISGAMKPGNYEVTWNGENYPSGVYFYELRTENFVSVRKMVLIK